jgi:GH15 family glucan-1,4-alpha-glucosidase
MTQRGGSPHEDGRVRNLHYLGRMASRIEDYAMIGDCQTAALVGRDGSIDWLCFLRFDAPACFAALLGTRDHGRWLLAPQGELKSVRRQYREGTLVLETEFETEEGVVAVIDAMPIRDGRRPHLVRVVEGRRGRVAMQMELILRFDYGSIVPWVRATETGLRAIGGHDAVRLVTPVALEGKDLTTVASFVVAEGERVPFVLSWHFSYEEPPPPIDAWETLVRTTAWWQAWSKRCTLDGGPWRDAVVRSLVTLKGLASDRTGGIVAAATTSLPEEIGGVRNWDYRYCWVRDATMTLLALLHGGYREEAAAWREWLLRAVAGSPGELQIMYGIGGERRLTELELPWLPGFGGSRPVRIGNAASQQLQLDVYGELMDCLYVYGRSGLSNDESGWNVQRALLNFLEGAWEEPDDGIWEVRGPRRHFTHSKMMAWVAFDRAIKSVEKLGLAGPTERWRAIRDVIFMEVCRDGWSPEAGAFTQYYGSTDLDAALLMMPLVGFLPANDPRVASTIRAIERGLLRDGFVERYETHGEVDGLPGKDGSFLPCTFWLADCLALQGRRDEARAIFERLLAIRNDVGLLSEEYDPGAKRMLGNFPQAFSHVALINTAMGLAPPERLAAPKRGE